MTVGRVNWDDKDRVFGIYWRKSTKLVTNTNYSIFMVHLPANGKAIISIGVSSWIFDIFIFG